MESFISTDPESRIYQHLAIVSELFKGKSKLKHTFTCIQIQHKIHSTKYILIIL